MYQIDTPHSTVVLSAPAAPVVPGYFQETDPAGTTEVAADWLNQVQENICRAITSAGLALNKNNVAVCFDQLYTAIGGGAAVNAVNNSGVGGAGANGIVVVVTFF